MAGAPLPIRAIIFIFCALKRAAPPTPVFMRDMFVALCVLMSVRMGGRIVPVQEYTSMKIVRVFGTLYNYMLNLQSLQ